MTYLRVQVFSEEGLTLLDAALGPLSEMNPRERELRTTELAALIARLGAPVEAEEALAVLAEQAERRGEQ